MGPIKMPFPDPNFVASVPLQYVFLDKDTGESLSAGVVKFWSNPEFTMPKNVYQITNLTGNNIEFVSLGNILTLSAIGTFVDGSGENLVPYYYPWTNPPTDDDPGDQQLYYVEVYSSDLILQFTLTEWPPNSLSGSDQVTFQEALTANLISNPQFSIVSYTPTPGVTSYTYSATGTTTFPVAPGWVLTSIGTATITVDQLSLSASIPSEAPYALSISWSTGLTSLKLTQRLTNSPRLLEGSIASASMVAASTGGSVNVRMFYEPSSGGSSLIVAGATDQNGLYTTIAGSEEIVTTNTANASGYVDFSIQIDSLTTGNTIKITSAQLVRVGSTEIVAEYLEQSTQQELNGLMWYYEPQLAYKPITNYTIGWDFPFNPCQALGPSIAASGLTANKSRYIADQTIAFESVGNVLSYSVSQTTGLTASTSGATQFALIQYLDARTAHELLSQRLSLQMKAGLSLAASTLTGYVNLYWTADATLPVLTAGTDNSLVSALTLGVPTTGNGTWNPVSRGTLGNAAFQLTPTSTVFNFNGWDATAVNTSTATFFAVVISFAEMPATNTMTIKYANLCGGDIATSPAPMNMQQTVQALEYYYENSYNLGLASGAVSSLGKLTIYQTFGAAGGNTNAYPTSFGFEFNAIKRTSPIVNLYAENGTINNVTAYASRSAPTNVAANFATTGWSSTIGYKGVSYYSATSSIMATDTSGAPTNQSQAWISFQYAVDARFGLAV